MRERYTSHGRRRLEAGHRGSSSRRAGPRRRQRRTCPAYHALFLIGVVVILYLILALDLMGPVGFSKLCMTLGNPVEEAEEASVVTPETAFVQQTHALSAGANNTALIRDGIAHISGENTYLQCETGEWPRVVAVALGNDHAIGLTDTGKVVYAGSNAQRQCELDTSGGRVCSIAAAPYTSYAVMDDGSVRVSGATEAQIEKLLMIDDAVDISAAQTHVLILRKDGTVLALGDETTGACNVRQWRDIVAISCGYCFSMGLDSRGQVWFAGNGRQGRSRIAEIGDATYIAAGAQNCYAVRQDGTVVVAGVDADEQAQLSSLCDVVEVAGGYRHAAALTRQGELTIVGKEPAAD